MPGLDVPFYSQSGAGDESLLRVKDAANSDSSPDVAYGLRPRPIMPKAEASVPVPDMAAVAGNAKVPDILFAGLQNVPPPTTIGQRVMNAAKIPAAPQMDPEYGNTRADYLRNLQVTDATKPEYRMGIGGRIMGTLANFLSGMRGAGPMVYTGRGATNSRYNQAERLRQEHLAADQAKINLMNQDYGLRDKLYQNERTRYTDQLHLDDLQDKRELEQYQRETEAQNERKQQEQTREGQLAGQLGGDAQGRIGILNTLDVPLTPAERQAFIESGKLPDNASTAGAIQRRQQAIRRQHRARPKVAVPPAQPVQSVPNDNPYR